MAWEINCNSQETSKIFSTRDLVTSETQLQTTSPRSGIVHIHLQNRHSQPTTTFVQSPMEKSGILYAMILKFLR